MTNLSNLFEWLKISNRPKTPQSRYHYFYHLDWLSPSSYHHDYPSALTGAICVFVAMCAVEYIQKSIGGKWDWLDILPEYSFL